MLRGSDIQRDGMFLELFDSKENQLFEAFYSDSTDEMQFTSFTTEDVPFEIIEEFLRQARILLTPIENKE